MVAQSKIFKQFSLFVKDSCSRNFLCAIQRMKNKRLSNSAVFKRDSMRLLQPFTVPLIRGIPNQKIIYKNINSGTSNILILNILLKVQ